MKVRPSVKKMCEKCRVIRRHGRIRVICENRAISAPRLKDKRRAVNDGTYRRYRYSRDKRLEVSLTYIYGIGRTTAIRICEDNGLDLNSRVSSLTEDEVNKIRSWVDANLTIEGDLRRDVQNDIKRKIEIGCHQGVRHRKGFLSVGSAPTPTLVPARARSALLLTRRRL